MEVKFWELSYHFTNYQRNMVALDPVSQIWLVKPPNILSSLSFSNLFSFAAEWKKKILDSREWLLDEERPPFAKATTNELKNVSDD